MDEYTKYLTDRLLSEEQPVTYRLLSRALDVHVNTAKEMLYDYHEYQNAQKPQSVHATYLIYGKKNVQEPVAEADVEMSSSLPEEDVLSEEVPTATLTLAREEQLKDILAEYKDVTSLHVYSLAPHPQRDLSLLADVSKSLAEYTIKDQDPGSSAKKYGFIGNTHVRRRDRKARPIPSTTSSTAKPNKSQAAPTKAEPQATQSKTASEAAKVKQEPSTESTAKTKAPAKDKAATSTAAKAPTPSLKRGGSGGIMQSFAKTKPPKPKPEVKKEEDTAMALSDDGEAGDDDIPETKKEDQGESLRKTKQQREDELRRMMEEDEEEEEDEPEEKDDPADAEMEEAPEPEPEPEPKPEKKEDKEPAEMVSSTENGRRRGKRKVMQKKRILDDQGYMVTIQEPGWESFSEDEAPPPSKKATPSSTPASSGGKPKKPAGKGAQGNIMSFFGKK